ncbi:hypothetical protein [Streptomyces sp. NPDC093089]|uniref:hypothetical protein n=1 Tax=Streptomyces sp. NPDC093089 TaxID=3366024 RepID=UPI00380F5229
MLRLHGRRIQSGPAGPQAGGRAYLARFDRHRTEPDGSVRAWHCADVPFAFGNHHNSDLAFLIGGVPIAPMTASPPLVVTPFGHHAAEVRGDAPPRRPRATRFGRASA